MFYDTIILGGGIMGAATADALLQRGQRVLLVEQFEPGHTRGSSHGDGRIIRFAYPEPIYVEMAMLAYPAWDTLIARAGEPLMQTTGGWDCGPADSLELHELEANFQHFAIPYERLTAHESNRRFPQFHLDEGSEAIYQSEAGVLFASRAVLALWRLVRAAGATTVTGERVAEVASDGEQVTVTTAVGSQWRAKRLIVTAGGWAKGVLAGLGLDLPLLITQEQVAYFAPQDDLDHRAEVMPVFIDYHPGNPFYGLPQIEIPGVKVGWHHMGQPIDPDHPQPLDPANLEATQRFVGARLPHLSQTPIEQLPCLYTNTPDYHFILDRHPALPNIIIGSGFSGHGFKFGPVIGSILAALALDEPPPLTLDTFSLSRFTAPTPLPRRTGA